jgi:hypothetical protein
MLEKPRRSRENSYQMTAERFPDDSQADTLPPSAKQHLRMLGLWITVKS